MKCERCNKEVHEHQECIKFYKRKTSQLQSRCNETAGVIKRPCSECSDLFPVYEWSPQKECYNCAVEKFKTEKKKLILTTAGRKVWIVQTYRDEELYGLHVTASLRDGEASMIDDVNDYYESDVTESSRCERIQAALEAGDVYRAVNEYNAGTPPGYSITIKEREVQDAQMLGIQNWKDKIIAREGEEPQDEGSIDKILNLLLGTGKSS